MRPRKANHDFTRRLEQLDDHQVLELFCFRQSHGVIQPCSPQTDAEVRQSFCRVLRRTQKTLASVEDGRRKCCCFSFDEFSCPAPILHDRVKHTRKPLNNSEAAAEYLIPSYGRSIRGSILCDLSSIPSFGSCILPLISEGPVRTPLYTRAMLLSCSKT